MCCEPQISLNILSSQKSEMSLHGPSYEISKKGPTPIAGSVNPFPNYRTLSSYSDINIVSKANNE